jgi:hypothetical protein
VVCFFCFPQIYNVSSEKTKRRASVSPAPPQPTKKRAGRKPKATPPEDTPATALENIPAPPLENPDPAFWTAKLDTLLKKKENTEFKDIKILLFFDQSTPDPHVFQSPGLELIIYQHMDGFPMFDPPSILEDLKFLGYYAITLHQRGIAFYATKDCTKGTSAKIGQFLRSFQGMYFPLSI